MIDYIPTEIVTYADDFPLSFHDAYPIVQLDKLLITYTDGTGTHTYGYDMAGTTSVLPAGGTVANAMPQCVGNAIFAFILKSYDNQVFKQSEVLGSIGVCYYVITDSTNELGLPIYYKLTPSISLLILKTLLTVVSILTLAVTIFIGFTTLVLPWFQALRLSVHSLTLI